MCQLSRICGAWAPTPTSKASAPSQCPLPRTECPAATPETEADARAHRPQALVSVAATPDEKADVILKRMEVGGPACAQLKR